MKNIFAVILAIVSINTLAQAQISTGQLNGQRVNSISTAVPFLTISPDARAGSMGDAGVAMSPDANSMHWNPSKLAFVEDEVGFSLAYTPWLQALVNDINLAYLSGYYKIDDQQTIGASLLYFSLGNIQLTNESGQNLNVIKPNELALDAAYSRKLSEDFSGSVAFRFIYSDIATGSISGGQAINAGVSGAADLSAYYKKDLEINGNDALLSFGGNVSNIGTKITYSGNEQRDFIPTNLRLGTALKLNLDAYNTITFTIDANKYLVPTNPIYAQGTDSIIAGRDPNRSVVSGIFGSFTDAPGTPIYDQNGNFQGIEKGSVAGEEINELYYGAGMEYWYTNQFSLRAGYFYEHPTKGNRQFLTIGAGLKYNVFGLDFAYLIPTEQRNPLEDTLRFTLQFDFDALKSN